MLIQQKRYFVVLHASRQVGKTSYLLALADYLNTEGTYRCLYMNAEMGQAMRENVDVAIQVILGELSSRARELSIRYVPGPNHASGVRDTSRRWGSKRASDPLVLSK